MGTNIEEVLARVDREYRTVQERQKKKAEALLKMIIEHTDVDTFHRFWCMIRDIDQGRYEKTLDQF